MDDYFFDDDIIVNIDIEQYEELVDLVIEVLKENGIDCDVELIAKECVQVVLLGRKEYYHA